MPRTPTNNFGEPWPLNFQASSPAQNDLRLAIAHSARAFCGLLENKVVRPKSPIAPSLKDLEIPGEDIHELSRRLAQTLDALASLQTDITPARQIYCDSHVVLDSLPLLSLAFDESEEMISFAALDANRPWLACSDSSRFS